MQKMARKNMTYLVPTLIVSALFAAIYAIHPLYMDDLWYTSNYRQYLAAGDDHYIIKSFIDTASEHFRYDNGRLGNVLAPLFLILPDALQGLLLGACVFFSIFFSAKLSGCWNRDWLTFAFIIFGINFFLPWNDRMFVRDFAINYLASGALALALTWLLTQGKLRRWPWALVLGLVCGWMHELFAATLLSMIVGLLIFCKESRKPQYYAAAIGLMLAIMYLMYVVPATGVRIREFYDDQYLWSGFKSLAGLPYLLPLFMFMITVAVFVLKKKHCNLVLYALLFASLAGLVAYRAVMNGARTAWPVILFSIVGTAYCLSRFKISNALWLIPSSLMLAAVLFNLIAALPWTYKMRMQNTAMNEALTKGDTPVFVDIINPLETPLYLFNKPNTTLPLWDFINYNRIIPRELETFDPAQAELIDPGLPLYRYKGWYLTDEKECDVLDTYIARFYFGNHSKDVILILRSFSNPNGTFTLISPINLRYDLLREPISKIEFLSYKNFKGFSEDNK